MNEIKNYGYLEGLAVTDYLLFVIYFIVILAISYYVEKKNVEKNEVYRYYTIGVIAKLLGGVFFCLIYIYYYNGGDTIAYYETSRALNNLFMENPTDFFTVVTEKASPENLFLFNPSTTGLPWTYMYFDKSTFMVAKIVMPLLFVTLNNYILATVLLSWISFTGIWKMYLLLTNYFKEISGRIAIAVLFIPSVVFWGSGIMKDTITLSASGWFIYSFHKVFIEKEKRAVNIFIMLVTGYLIVGIKAYIMAALLPGAIIWMMNYKISTIRNTFFKYSLIPMIYLMSFVIGYGILTFATNFDINKSLVSAIEKQADLKKDYYGGSSFDIGETEASLTGVLSKAPAAIVAGLYRPFIFEARNVVMALSGLENLIYLYLTVMIFVKLKLGTLLKLIFDNPILLFSISYVIMFSMIVGVSTSNFGALVRFKIPYLPFLLTTLLALNYLIKKNSLSRGSRY